MQPSPGIGPRCRRIRVLVFVGVFRRRHDPGLSQAALCARAPRIAIEPASPALPGDHRQLVGAEGAPGGLDPQLLRIGASLPAAGGIGVALLFIFIALVFRPITSLESSGCRCPGGMRWWLGYSLQQESAAVTRTRAQRVARAERGERVDIRLRVTQCLRRLVMRRLKTP